MPDPVSSFLAATETARLRAENRILAAEVVRARDAARLMALVAQRANDALEVLVRHMTAHSTTAPQAHTCEAETTTPARSKEA